MEFLVIIFLMKFEIDLFKNLTIFPLSFKINLNIAKMKFIKHYIIYENV